MTCFIVSYMYIACAVFSKICMHNPCKAGHHKPMKKSKTIGIGTTIGFINGLFGAGGGALLVPALEKFVKCDTHKAHGTTVAVMLPLSTVSAAVYIWGVDVDWWAVLGVSAGGVAGGLVGAKLLAKLTVRWLNILFGAFLIAGAARMIFK